MHAPASITSTKSNMLAKKGDLKSRSMEQLRDFLPFICLEDHVSNSAVFNSKFNG